MGRNVNPKQGGKGPSLRGALMIDTFLGNVRARKWPERRPNRPPMQLFREEKFGAVQRLWRYIDPQFQKVFRETSEGTPFYPRDLYTSAVYGRLFGFQGEDQSKVIYPMAARIEVNQSLLTLGNPVIGDVLTFDGEYWRPSAFSVTSPRYSGYVADTFSSAAIPMRGHFFRAGQAAQFNGLSALVYPVPSSSSYRAMIATVDATWKILTIAKSPTINLATAGTYNLRFPLAAPFIIGSGDMVALIIVRTDAGVNGVSYAGAFSNKPNPYDIIAQHVGNTVNHNATDINVGDTIGRAASTTSFNIGFEAVT